MLSIFKMLYIIGWRTLKQSAFAIEFNHIGHWGTISHQPRAGNEAGGQFNPIITCGHAN